ncbi:MAG: hypothetical protein WCE95_02975, partial [Nitrososphaeraceae archaeon]
FGWLPMLAALAMAMSSVTVVGNSILLNRYKPKSLLTTTELQKTLTKNPKEKTVDNQDLPCGVCTSLIYRRLNLWI